MSGRDPSPDDPALWDRENLLTCAPWPWFAMDVFAIPRNRPNASRRDRPLLVVGLLLGGWAAWLLLVLLLVFIAPAEGSGSRWPLTRAELGQFGDSFGVLSSLMASFAAVFTWRALQDERKRNDEASRWDHERAIEATFFRMLETRRQLVSEVTFKSQTSHVHKGADAFDAMRREVTTLYLAIGAQASYDSVINRAGGSIQHYFRLSCLAAVHCARPASAITFPWW